jgi:hypothetical protein
LIGQSARWAIILLISLVTAIAVIGQLTITQAPEANALAISMIVQASVICGLAAWIDQKRQLMDR